MYLEEMFSLKGKVALVTGGGRGIGQVVALGLARAGAVIVNFARSGADETVKLIEAEGGKCYDYRVDVTKEEEVVKAVGEVFEKLGGIHVVFNNAGVCIHQDTLDALPSEWREVIEINLTGEFFICQEVGRKMIEKGIKGSIINMASMSGSIVNVPQWQVSYNASKAGVIHMTRSLAVEWAEFGIRVNSISPGYIATPMSVDTPQELKDAWIPLIPQLRMGNPEELIPAILYLASDAAGYTTGADLIIDGGYSVR
ncbi:MAG: SDR family oxidoreductase [Lachnospiraceae bacterium]|nr:SDR family oxidoreductase [Lachnospiraceae bacterium]